MKGASVIDVEDETAKFKMFMAAVVVFLFSAYFSYEELKYSLWGKVTSATVTQVVHVPARRRSPAHQLVKYSYQEQGGASGTGEFKASESSHVDTGAELEVQYLAGDDSRLNGEKNTISVIVFFVTLAFLAFSIFQMARQANPGYLQKAQGARRRR
jgi:hypothetical protein